uniref:Uncharacterized protein n=1 Tax=Anguilla anguilla TaxID=7936 RepID=A0A0E9R838_ANGAN
MWIRYTSNAEIGNQLSRVSPWLAMILSYLMKKKLLLT